MTLGHLASCRRSRLPRPCPVGPRSGPPALGGLVRGPQLSLPLRCLHVLTQERAWGKAQRFPGSSPGRNGVQGVRGLLPWPQEACGSRAWLRVPWSCSVRQPASAQKAPCGRGAFAAAAALGGRRRLFACCDPAGGVQSKGFTIRSWSPSGAEAPLMQHKKDCLTPSSPLHGAWCILCVSPPPPPGFFSPGERLLLPSQSPPLLLLSSPLGLRGPSPCASACSTLCRTSSTT